MKNIIPVIFKHTVDMFHGTISWKIKRSFYRNLEKMSALLPVDLMIRNIELLGIYNLRNLVEN